jgi:ABC-type branched-subunit amino acid transport system substrate-binding protein
VRKNTLLSLILPLILVLALAGCSLPKVNLPALPFLNRVKPCPGLTIGLLIADTKTDPVAQEQNDGYTLAAQEINAAGGINGCKLALVTAQEASDENSVQTRQAVRDLVEDGQVIAILGGTTSVASMQAASLVNYFETPLLVPSAGGSHVLPTDNLWSFRLHAPEDAYAQQSFAMVKQELGDSRSVAVIFEDTTEGNDAAVAAVNTIEAMGLIVNGYYPIGLGDSAIYANLASQVTLTRPDVAYLIFSQPLQAADVRATLSALDRTYQPEFTIVRSGGFASQSFLSDEGTPNTLAENLIIATQWVSIQGVKDWDDFTQAFDEYTQKEYGQANTPSLYAIEAYKSLHIIAATAGQVLATGKATPTDTVKLRAALREALFAYQENSSTWGKITFSAGGQNPGEITLVQVKDGKFGIVYPPDKAEQIPVRTSGGQ